MFEKIKRFSTSKEAHKIAGVISILMSVLMFLMLTIEENNLLIIALSAIYFLFAGICQLMLARGIENCFSKINMKLFKLFYMFKLFVDELFESPLKSWLVVSFILFLLIYFFETTGSFWGDIFVSMIIGVVSLIPLVFFLGVLVVVLEIIKSVWSLFLNQNEYKSFVSYYENLKYEKLKRELDSLQEDLKHSTPSYQNSNFLSGLLVGLGIGWFLFDVDSD
ncbi:MAG TPA: hypothetical protein EYH01_10740 [Campylobacterales bacterium]|nr:hypothetical protein [Campylobacterales bacterium]